MLNFGGVNKKPSPPDPIDGGFGEEGLSRHLIEHANHEMEKDQKRKIRKKGGWRERMHNARLRGRGGSSKKNNKKQKGAEDKGDRQHRGGGNRSQGKPRTLNYEDPSKLNEGSKRTKWFVKWPAASGDRKGKREREADGKKNSIRGETSR